MKLFLLLNFSSIMFFTVLSRLMATTDYNAKGRKLDNKEVKAAIVSHLEGLTTNSCHGEAGS